MKIERGFTLIELLIVIAIIGILAVVTVAGLNSARSEAKDSIIKVSVSQIRRVAEISREDNGDCDSICTEAEITGGITTGVLNNGGTIVCNDNAAGYCASSVLNDGTHICVDNMEAPKFGAAGCGAGTSCP